MKHRKHRTKYYNVADPKARFSTLVREALRGEDAVIVRDHKALLKIVPVDGGTREPGSAKKQVRMAPDFDAALEDFAGVSPRYCSIPTHFSCG